MKEYRSICARCGKEFVFQRKRKMSPAQECPQYCHDCRGLMQRENQYSSRHRNEPESRYVDNMGYVHIRIGDTYVVEHRYVMEQMLGRKLKKGENVHHIDGARANNDRQNLELWVKPQLAGVRAKDLICPHCGKSYLSF